MADFAWDYEKLYAMQAGLHRLADQAGQGGGSGAWAQVGAASLQENDVVFGDLGLAEEFAVFFGKAKRRIEEGTDKLKRFGDIFQGLADALFQSDAGLAHSAATQTLASQRDAWNAQRDAHDDWEADKAAWDEYLEEIGAADYFREHPDADISEVCGAGGEDEPAWCETWRNDMNDPDRDPPSPPGEEPPTVGDSPPSHLTYVNPVDGTTTELTLSYDEEEGHISREWSVTTLLSGETISIITDWDGPPIDRETSDGKPYNAQDHTITTLLPDGTQVMDEFDINDDGSGTRTETRTYTEGDETKTETTEYTRSGPFEEWLAPR
jgi:hypothetical protein